MYELKTNANLTESCSRGARKTSEKLTLPIQQWAPAAMPKQSRLSTALVLESLFLGVAFIHEPLNRDSAGESTSAVRRLHPRYARGHIIPEGFEFQQCKTENETTRNNVCY